MSDGTPRPPWDGRWLVLVVSVPEAQRALRHQLRTQLAYHSQRYYVLDDPEIKQLCQDGVLQDSGPAPVDQVADRPDPASAR